jgi:IclR family acetate operon transcriptional repressor
MLTEVPSPEASPSSGVQSLHRALDLLEVLVAHDGRMAIAEIAVETGLPLPTIHRILGTLVERGYIRRLLNRQYALGFALLPLGLAANALIGVDARPILADLVSELGETANFAVLVDDSAEYVAQVPSPHAMRMFTEVGKRVHLHSTGVGKALLAQMPVAAVSSLVRRVGLPASTVSTITTENALLAELGQTRERGYAMDEEEQELGVRCVAVGIPGAFLSPMAISVSGPISRMTDSVVERTVPLVSAAARRLGDQIAMRSSEPVV